ncbi:Nucleotide-diphospho-sugar transferase, partial [Cynara cardunculus var. scolymus]
MIPQRNYLTDPGSLQMKYLRAEIIDDEEFHGDELEEALAKAATENNTVILAVANKAYTEGDKPMLDIFLDAFWLGLDTHPLTKHLLIVAVDQTAYDRCNFLNLHCYKLETEGVTYDGEKLFIVDNFNGDQWSDNNPINTGFYMIRSNEKTIALYDEWYDEKDRSPGKKEQDVLFDLMRKGAFKRLGLQVRFLDTIFFSGFCQNSRDVNVVSTIHANCCRSIRAKVSDLIAVLHDWKRFKASSGDVSNFKWSEHIA